MTKREAMRRVLEHAAGMIGAAPDNGDLGIFVGDDGEPVSDADYKRLSEACRVLDAQLSRRAARRGGR